MQNHNKPTTPFNSSYNPSSASAYAFAHKKSESIGRCAGFVGEAMRYGGYAGSMSDRPMSACAYSKFMKFWGFNEVYANFGRCNDGWSKIPLSYADQEEKRIYYPLDGDVAVIAGTNKKKHGHIHIYNAANKVWVSDFACDTVWCYGDEGRPYIIYRWKIDTTNNPTA